MISKRSEPIPRWLMIRYVILWKKFKRKMFTFEGAKKILKEKDDRLLSVALSALSRYGWLESKQNKENSRKRLYLLASPEDVVQNIDGIKK